MNSAKLRQLLLELGIVPEGERDTPIYIFPSDELRHVWIGLQRGLWAVGDITSDQQISRETKANQMPIGAHGLFYCSDAKCFTVPFIIESHPEHRDVSDIWPGVWHFPFRIRPLGDLGKRISLSTAKHEWKTLKGVSNITKVLRISGSMAFVPSWLYASDWQLILQKLSSRTTVA